MPSERRYITPAITLPPHGLNIDTKLHWPAERSLLESRMLEERLAGRTRLVARQRAGPGDARHGGCAQSAS